MSEPAVAQTVAPRSNPIGSISCNVSKQATTSEDSLPVPEAGGGEQDALEGSALKKPRVV